VFCFVVQMLDGSAISTDCESYTCTSLGTLCRWIRRCIPLACSISWTICISAATPPSRITRPIVRVLMLSMTLSPNPFPTICTTSFNFSTGTLRVCKSRIISQDSSLTMPLCFRGRSLGIALAFSRAFETARCFCCGTRAAPSLARAALYIWAFSARRRSRVVLARNASRALFRYLRALSFACTRCLASSCCIADVGEFRGSWFSRSSALILRRLFRLCAHRWGLRRTIPSRSEYKGIQKTQRAKLALTNRVEFPFQDTHM